VFIINSYQLEKTKQPQVRLTDLFAYTFGLVYHRVPNALPVAKSTLVAFCSGVYQSAVFSSKQSMQTHYYRVEYGLQKQKPRKMLCGLGSWFEQQLND
jgi:hypothetical protein